MTYGGLALLFQVGAGGQGTVPFAIAGIVLLAAAAAVVVIMVRAGVRSLSRWRFD